MIPVNTNFPDRIGAALTATFPEIGPVDSVSVLKDGFRNVVTETPAGQIFKIAKSWEASATFSKEVQYLPALAERITVEIPVPRWHVSRSREFPFGAIGYPKLPGAPLTSEILTPATRNTLAREIGTLAASLHDTPPEATGASSLPGPEAHWYEQRRVRDAILPLLRDELTKPEYDVVARWWNTFLGDRRMRAFTPVVVHGDLEPGNILVSGEPKQVTGVVDFEGLAVGDPAQDLAAQLHLGRDFALAVVDHYHAAGGILDADFEYRVQRLWELRGFDGMRLAIHNESQREFDRSLARLRQGPLLHDTTRRETIVWPPLRD